MQQDLIYFWQRFQPEPNQLYLHPDDRAWMQQHWPAPLAEPYLDWPAYRNSKRFGSRDRNVHFSLLPVPFWGDLRSASVLICLANAGFDNTLYYLESHEPFREIHLRTLQQDCAGMDFPFIHLDPRFSWSGPFAWWETRLRPLMHELQADGLTYLESLHRLSRQIAVLQIFPYHSLDGSRLKGKSGPNRMPSVLAAQQHLAEASRRTDQLTVVMRSHADWHTANLSQPGEHHAQGPRLQGVSFHPRFDVGSKILTRLRSAR